MIATTGMWPYFVVRTMDYCCIYRVQISI